MNTRELSEAITELQNWLNWNRDSLGDFHRYAHRFKGTPGSNVFTFVLQDALRYRGLTLEQFQSEIAND